MGTGTAGCARTLKLAVRMRLLKADVSTRNPTHPNNGGVILSQQAIPTPFGVSVFGSATLRVAPDVAVIHFSVSQLKSHPKEAFAAVREEAKRVQTFLAGSQIKDAGSSQISLNEQFEYDGRAQKFAGYRTRIDFRVILPDLNRVEEILSGIVDAGANNIQSVSFQTTRLKQFRADARRQAIAAARDKAELYCQAAGVELGEIIHIEDVNPDQLRGREGHGHMQADLSI
jgi:uncharacterized protein